MLAASAVSGQAQGVDPLTRGIVVPPPTGRSCSADPITETGAALTNLIAKLEEDVRRDTQLLRNLDRRFKMNNRELEQLGAVACQQHADAMKRIVTESFTFGFDQLKSAAASTRSVSVAGMLTDQNKPFILNLLRNQTATGNSLVAGEAAAAIRMIEDGTLTSATPRQMDVFFKSFDAAYKGALAVTPAMFECSEVADEPKWDPKAKALAAGLRSVLGKVNPVLEVALDEDNYIAAITYFTTRNRIEQWDELNDMQLKEWGALTCNLQRHTKTLNDARTKARPVTTTASRPPQGTTPPRKSGVGKTIGTIAAVGVAAGGGLYAYNTYKTSQEETQALLDDIAGLRNPTSTNTTTTTTTTTTSGGNYSATVARSCTLGPSNTNPLSSSFIEGCTQATAGGSCGPTSFTFTVTGSTVRDCAGWFGNGQVSGNTLTAVYTGVCGAGGITVSGTPGGTISGTGTCRGNSYTVTITTTRQ